MKSHFHSMHTHQGQQVAHAHEHPHQVINNTPKTMNGVRMMRFLGWLQRHIPLDQGWLSDYRSARIVPVSNRVLFAALFVLLLGIAAAYFVPANLKDLGILILIFCAVPVSVLLVGGLYLTLYRRDQRHKTRLMIVDSISWNGSEHVLDVGCGTGMTLNAVAHKLTLGRAVGIDLWQQAIGGTCEALLANARAEGVIDKIEIQEMDARRLTFDDASFDVVTSSFALHHIITQVADLTQTVGQMARVLKPGGYLVLLDIGPMIDLAEVALAQSELHVVKQGESASFRCVVARKV